MHIILESYPQLNNVYLTDTMGNIFIESLLPTMPQTNLFRLEMMHIPAQTVFASG